MSIMRPYALDIATLSALWSSQDEELLEALLIEEASGLRKLDERLGRLISQGKSPKATSLLTALIMGQELGTCRAMLRALLELLCHRYGRILPREFVPALMLTEDEQLMELLSELLHELGLPEWLSPEALFELQAPRAPWPLEQLDALIWLDPAACEQADQGFSLIDPEELELTLEEHPARQRRQLMRIFNELEHWISACSERGFGLVIFLD